MWLTDFTHDLLIQLMFMCCAAVCGVIHGWCCFFFQAEDGIRDLVRSRGLGDVYKRQDARAAQANLQRERERISWQIGELDKLSPGDGEWDLSLIHI